MGLGLGFQSRQARSSAVPISQFCTAGTLVFYGVGRTNPAATDQVLCWCCAASGVMCCALQPLRWREIQREKDRRLRHNGPIDDCRLKQIPHGHTYAKIDDYFVSSPILALHHHLMQLVVVTGKSIAPRAFCVWQSASRGRILQSLLTSSVQHDCRSFQSSYLTPNSHL